MSDIIKHNPYELALVTGDLSGVKPEERVQYYNKVCESVGLNPLTQPFQYIKLNGKLRLYATKDCAAQLRSLHKVSITIVNREVIPGGQEMYSITARGTTPEGRVDESIAVVTLPKSGDNRANAIMKCETKAKRRVTLSICGLGFLDENETETIPEAQYVEVTEEGVVKELPTRKQLKPAKPQKSERRPSPTQKIKTFQKAHSLPDALVNRVGSCMWGAQVTEWQKLNDDEKDKLLKVLRLTEEEWDKGTEGSGSQVSLPDLIHVVFVEELRKPSEIRTAIGEYFGEVTTEE